MGKHRTNSAILNCDGNKTTELWRQLHFQSQSFASKILNFSRNVNYLQKKVCNIFFLLKCVNDDDDDDNNKDHRHYIACHRESVAD